MSHNAATHSRIPGGVKFSGWMRYPPTMSNPAELRRSVRIPTTVLVKLRGVHGEPCSFRANVSAGGIYLYTDQPLCEVGGLEHMQVISEDGVHNVSLPVVCVRVVSMEDAFEGKRIEGIAFQFVPRVDAELAELRALMSNVVEEHLSNAKNMLFPTENGALVRDASDTAHKAKIGGLSGTGIALLMNQPTDEGAEISISIKPGSGNETVFRGIVNETICVTPQKLYRVDVQLIAPKDLRQQDPMALLLDSLVHPANAIGGISLKRPLFGALERFPIKTIYEVIEREMLSGLLSIQNLDDNAQVFITGGRPVDVEASWNIRTPEIALQTLLGWERGKFSLHPGALDRPVKTSSTFSEVMRRA